MLQCCGCDVNKTLVEFKENLKRYNVIEATLHRTYNSKKQCYWSVFVVARPGDPLIFNKDKLKISRDYFTAFKPVGSMFLGLVESKNVKAEGATVFFRVITCECPSYFQTNPTTVPSKGKLLIIEKETNIFCNTTDFIELLSEIYESLDSVIVLFTDDDHDDDDDLDNVSEQCINLSICN